MTSRSSNVTAAGIQIVRVTDGSADALFVSKRQSALPAYIEALKGYKVGDVGKLALAGTDDDKARTANFLRRAAAKLDLGVKVVISPDGKTLSFRVKSRTIRTRNSAE